MFTDGLVFDVILILAVTHQTLFVGFFFLVAYWWFLVERNVGVRRIDRLSTLKKSQSPPKKRNVFTHVASSNANLMEKKPFLHKKKVQLWQDWFGTADDMAAVLFYFSSQLTCKSGRETYLTNRLKQNTSEGWISSKIFTLNSPRACSVNLQKFPKISPPNR